MKVEKLSTNKVRIYLTYEDLNDRGIDREEIWQNGRKVQELFWDMMEHAYAEVGFEVAGPLAVEAFTMPTEGIVVIVTQLPPSMANGTDSALLDEEDDLELDAVPADLSEAFIFVFQDFEDAIRAAHSLRAHDGLGGSLYHYKNRYHLFFDEEEIAEDQYDTVWSILHEYGDLSATTKAMLEEYGKCVMNGNAVQTLTDHFPLQ
ncbi:adaptor protein MecA [Tumebacillus sp. ITR2]|uniref:Adaptor protein MecA n=1 Tax=Tumebacillus amylolyticus TaxID=2801339 RepID=A0ABS1JBV6_9BACL|nr:adaptor protein MecA [Tumebacillus amylolyticus]MBL0387746.1 adaptor protein MecA [Tumebacillus amylolyticus]